MKWEDIAYIKDSPLSRKILDYLANSERPLTPLEISRKTNIASSNVSTKLGLLRKRKLVVCINPETKKSRFYKVTPSGKRILSELRKMS